jgi:hypothetical protein
MKSCTFVLRFKKIDHVKNPAGGNTAVTIEQELATFVDRWITLKYKNIQQVPMELP